MTDSFNKYCHLVAVLPPDTVRLIMDIIEVMPDLQLYETLKERLLSHYQMSEYKRLDKLFTMPDLGSRKLSPCWKCVPVARSRPARLLGCSYTACLGNSAFCWPMRTSVT
jgi:hypothetical protein